MAKDGSVATFLKFGGYATSLLTIAILLAAFPLNARLDRVEDAQKAREEQVDLHIEYIHKDVAEVKEQMQSVTEEVSEMKEGLAEFKIELIREIQNLAE